MSTILLIRMDRAIQKGDYNAALVLYASATQEENGNIQEEVIDSTR